MRKSFAPESETKVQELLKIMQVNHQKRHFQRAESLLSTQEIATVHFKRIRKPVTYVFAIVFQEKYNNFGTLKQFFNTKKP